MASKKFQSFAEKIEDRYGDTTINIHEDFTTDEKVSIIPTSSIALNASLGIGGIPLGRITTIFGPESSAKTSLALDITKHAIQLGYNVLYVDAEQGLDHNYIRQIVGNVTSQQLLTPQPETAEQALYICEEGVKSGDFHVIILDSIGALAPEKEKEDDYGKDHVALIPRKLSAFLRRNGFQIRANNIAFIFINQVRANIGSYVGGVDMPGGYALRHWSSVVIQLNRSEQLKVVEDGNDTVIGILSRFNIKKNKLASPFKVNTFPLIFGKGIDTPTDLVDYAEYLGVLTKRGAYYVFEGENIGQGRFKTIENIRVRLELLDKIQEKVYNIINKTNQERSETDAESTETQEDILDGSVPESGSN